MNKSPKHTFKKSGIYYFVRRIPKHVREFYSVDKISFSLKTTCDAVASRRAQRLTNLLDEQWFAMGIQQDV
ncbi:DUF6538 domain-containing protein, partial [Salibaculum griseiflavum]|uniref:DUF6538 domain-containing protein n=1 Tax=Salibaculum griseiflavum TaxID=1914409 RepID=UPI0038B5188F